MGSYAKCQGPQEHPPSRLSSLKGLAGLRKSVVPPRLDEQIPHAPQSLAPTLISVSMTLTPPGTSQKWSWSRPVSVLRCLLISLSIRALAGVRVPFRVQAEPPSSVRTEHTVLPSPSTGTRVAAPFGYCESAALKVGAHASA